MALPIEIKPHEPKLSSRDSQSLSFRRVLHALRTNTHITERGKQLQGRGITALYLERRFRNSEPSHKVLPIESIWMVETNIRKRALVVHLENGDHLSKLEVPEQSLVDFIYLRNSDIPPAFDFSP